MTEFINKSGFPGSNGIHSIRRSGEEVRIGYTVFRWSAFWAQAGCDMLSAMAPNLDQIIPRIRGVSRWHVEIQFQAPYMRESVNVAETSSNDCLVSCRPPF